MIDQRVQKLAKVLVNFSLEVKKGDKVLIEGESETKSLLIAAVKEVLKAGGHPEIKVYFPEYIENILKNGTEEQITHINNFEIAKVEKFDCILSLFEGENLKTLSNINSEKMRKFAESRSESNKKFMNKISSGELRWVGAQFPLNGVAQEAEMSLEDYSEFVFKACKVDKENPVEEWKKLRDFQEKIVEYLDNVDKIRIVSEGTDLSMRVKGRKWINSYGKKNMPDGEVYTSPIEDSVNGNISFDFPAIFQGREVKNIRLKFKDGKCIEAKAEKGEEYLNEILNIDDGSKYLGEVAVGTNYDIPKFTKNILFDEKLGNTVHIAMGNGFKESGSKNESGIHWDMICDMKNGGVIYADDKKIYEDGKFII